jgi:hypothetical protein
MGIDIIHNVKAGGGWSKGDWKKFMCMKKMLFLGSLTQLCLVSFDELCIFNIKPNDINFIRAALPEVFS